LPKARRKNPHLEGVIISSLEMADVNGINLVTTWLALMHVEVLSNLLQNDLDWKMSFNPALPVKGLRDLES
jgi:hypothetical protein